MSKKKLVLKIIIGTLAVVLALTSASIAYVYNALGKINTQPLSKNNADLGIKENVANTPERKDIVNIALFGLDRRGKEKPHSDSIIIATIDYSKKKIKLSSILRDTYVNIDNRGMDKINHAYNIGGPQLAIKTINENFDMNIRDYISVDFYGMEKIIDDLGGITIEVKDKEVDNINKYITEVAELEKKPPTLLTSGGEQRLNGMQAVAFSRIRSVGNGDYERTSRQRRVLTKIFQSIKEKGVTSYTSIVNSALPFVETSLTSSNILSLGTDIFSSGIAAVEQEQFPREEDGSGEMIDGIWYFVADLNKITKYLHSYIYDDVNPPPVGSN